MQTYLHRPPCRPPWASIVRPHRQLRFPRGHRLPEGSGQGSERSLHGPEVHVYRVEYDIVHNGLSGIIATEGAEDALFLVVNCAKIRVIHKTGPANISWGKTGAECLSCPQASSHKEEGRAAPLGWFEEGVHLRSSENALPIYVVGVIHKDYIVVTRYYRMPLAQPDAVRPSPGSCTTSSASLKASWQWCMP